MLNMYRLTLTSGVERLVTREEDENKSVIGLWIWARRQHGVHILDFNECVVDAAHIMMIDRPETVAAIDDDQDTMLVHRLDDTDKGYVRRDEVDPAWFLTAKEGSVKEDED